MFIIYFMVSLLVFVLGLQYSFREFKKRAQDKRGRLGMSADTVAIEAFSAVILSFVVGLCWPTALPIALTIGYVHHKMNEIVISLELEVQEQEEQEEG